MPSEELSEHFNILEQSYKGTVRLNFQHWFGVIRQGFYVHPSVSLGENAVIADLGTGTGAWMFELAEKLPRTTRFDGLDVTLRHLPNEKWLPENIRGVQLDIYDPIPPALFQKYDFIHIRYLGIYVRDCDPVPVIEQIKKLVKPGGYIQWTENDLWADQVEKASEDLKSTGTEKLYSEIMKVLASRFGESPGWAPTLPDDFRSCGLTDVVCQYHTPSPEMWPAIHDNFLSGWEEVSKSVPNSADFKPLFEEAAAEIVASKRGVAVVGHALTVVGRAPKD